MFRAVLPPVLGLVLACTAYSQPGIYVRSDGNVGINHTDPSSTLIVNGAPGTIRIGVKPTHDGAVSGALIFEENLYETSGNASFCGMALRYNKELQTLDILGGCPSSIDAQDADNQIMSISRDGNIGIGAAPDTFKLQVAGGIRSEEVIVETGWADFVFDDTYILRPLDEVRAFIQTHRHLPDIPAGHQIESNGLPLGEISMRFMQKIEELTLYTIDQQEQLKRQEKEISDLRQTVAALAAHIEQMEARQAR